MKRHKVTYTDGSVRILRDASEDGENKNPETDGDLQDIVALMFGYETIRTEDLQFLETADVSETVKIRVPESGKVKAGMYAILMGVLYYIYRADPNRTLHNVYLYMKEARHGFDG